MAGYVYGAWYQRCHSMARTSPSEPGMIKAHYQPSHCIVQTVSGGVIIAPSPAPNIKVATAVERSLAGNHCATTLLAAGEFAASAMPRITLSVKKLHSPRPKACRIVATLQNTAARLKARLVPNRSFSGPEISWPTP